MPTGMNRPDRSCLAGSLVKSPRDDAVGVGSESTMADRVRYGTCAGTVASNANHRPPSQPTPFAP